MAELVAAANEVVVMLRGAPASELAERTLDEMIEGWRNQQLARSLSFGTIDGREAEVRRFVTQAGEYP